MFSKITISGKICTGKSSVFRELLKKLQWPTFSTGAYFRDYAKTHKLILNTAEEQSEILTRKVDDMVKKKLKAPGNLLLDAWLGGVLAEGIEDVLKVLLIADNDTRFKRFAIRENISYDEAKKEVILRDSSWFEKVKNIYKRTDFFDKKNYSLVIDTSSQTVNDIVSLILKRLS